MKKWATVIVAVLMVAGSCLLPFTVFATQQVQPPPQPHWGLAPGEEIVALRTRTSSTTFLGLNEEGNPRYALDASLASMHYKDDPDDPYEQWKVIDTAIVASDRPNWDWEVVKGNWHLLIKDDTTVALGKNGNWIGFRYAGLAYYDAGTKDYVTLQSPQSVTPTVTANRIRWEGIFPACNLEYIYGPDGFKENLEVTQAARDWAAAHPPSLYGLNNADSYLVGYLECDWTGSFPAELETGQVIDWDSALEYSGLQVFWRDPIKDKIVTALPVGHARHIDETNAENYIPIRQRFYQANDKHWLLFGAKVTDLNALPSGTIVIDPTVDEEVGAGADDVWYRRVNVGWYPTETYGKIGNVSDNNDYGHGVAYRFTGVNIPDGAIISEEVDECNLLQQCAISGSTTVCNSDVLCENASNPGQITDGPDYLSRSRTAAVAWDSVEAWVGGTWYTSPQLAAAVQEVVDDNSGTGDALIVFHEDADYESDAGARRLPAMYEHATRGPSQIYIVWEAGGVSAPTLTTNAAYSVEETTAGLSGNITNTGGENADFRGFCWDTSSQGDPGDAAPAVSGYSDNWTEGGSFGICNFTHALSALTKGEAYYYRAYAHNTGGWNYGDEQKFLTKPDEPTGLSLTPGDEQVSVNWTKGDGALNTIVRGTIDSYPADYESGTGVYDDTGTSVLHTSLTNGDDWYYRLWSKTIEDGMTSYSDAYDEDHAVPRGLPTVVSGNMTLVEETTATGNGNITSVNGDNCDKRGFVYSTSTHADPGDVAPGSSGYESYAEDEGDYGTGAYTKALTGLTKGELYYVRAYAHNDAGYDYSAVEQTFLTKPDEPSSLVATAGDEQVGLTWSKGDGAGDTIIRGKIDEYPANYDTDTDVYSDTGESTTHSSLTNGDHWYYRAWSYVTEGALEQYSDTYDQADATPSTLPTVVSSNMTLVEETTATGNANITNTGGDNCDTRGFVYSTSTHADPGNVAPGASGYESSAYDTGDYGTGAYTKGLTGLTSGEYYYVRAYVHNDAGYDYSDVERVFLTKPQAPSNLNATAGTGQIGLSWSKGTGAQNTVVRGQKNSYPADYESGSHIYNSTGTGVTHSGLDGGDAWYYRAWSYVTENGLEQYSDDYSQDNAVVGVEAEEEEEEVVSSTATMLEVLPFLDEARIVANSAPSSTLIGVQHGYIMPVYADDDQELYYDIAVPRLWDAESDIIIRLAVSTNQSETDAAFRFLVSWRHWTPGTDDVQVSSNDVEVETETGEADQYESFDVEATVDYDLTSGNEVAVGDILAFRVRRVAAVTGNETTGDILLHHAGVLFTEADEEANMEEVASALEELTLAAGVGLRFLPLIFFSALAFWRAQPILFIICGAVSLFTGLYWFDDYGTSAGLATSMALIVYTLLCFGYAFRYMFWKKQEEDE